MTRIIIYHPESGVYLGHDILGFHFWSNLDPSGQTAAVTFASEEEARDYIAELESAPNADVFVYVVVEVENGIHATIEECTAAGLPMWIPEVENWPLTRRHRSRVL